MEEFKERLVRIMGRDPREFAFNIRFSFENYFVPEIRAAHERGFYTLTIIGIHSVMQTVSEYVFGKRGIRGTEFYLRHFVDGDVVQHQFSIEAKRIHQIRNIVAHRWSSGLMHYVVFDDTVDGWRRVNNTLYLNLDVYAQHFFAGWEPGGSIYDWTHLLKDIDMSRQRLLFLRDWLHLRKGDGIYEKIQEFQKVKGEVKRQALEGEIREAIRELYGVSTQ